MSKILELAKRIASTGGLETKTTETISGTYDSAGQQRLLSHAYTIGANLTITNGELILSRLADNGTGMTVEFGSDVTLSGDGTLMLGDLGQGQPNQDFSASRITGTLPSTVFPAGHVLQVVYKESLTSGGFSYTSDTLGFDFGSASSRGNGTFGGLINELTTTFTTIGNNSHLFINYCLTGCTNSDPDGAYDWGFGIFSSADSYANLVAKGDNTNNTNTKMATNAIWIYPHTSNYSDERVTGHVKHSPSLSASTSLTYKFCIDSTYNSGGNTVSFNKRYSFGNNANDHAPVGGSVVIMEIQG